MNELIRKWAGQLTGREYPFTMTNDEKKRAQDDDIVIVYGLSDDLLEFEGAIYDECGAWNGTTVRLCPEGIYDTNSMFWKKIESGLSYSSEQIMKMPVIEAVWCPQVDNVCWASWEIRTNMKHMKFDIMEDGKLYCRGIIFHINEISRVINV